MIVGRRPEPGAIAAAIVQERPTALWVGSPQLVKGIFAQTEAIACHRFWPDRHEETYRASAPAVNYVGRPHPLLASKVVDLDGVDLVDEPGTPGEAVYRSPSVAHGYYRDPEATREAFRDGWFHSGDSCAYDADGPRVMVDSGPGPPPGWWRGIIAV